MTQEASPNKTKNWLTPGHMNLVGAYAVAVAITLAALGLHRALSVWSGTSDPAPILFLPAIIVSAYLGGVGPGLTATAVAAFGTPLALVGVDFSLVSANSIFIVRWLALWISGGLISILIEGLHRAHARTEVSLAEKRAAEAQLRSVVGNTRCILWRGLVEAREGWETDAENQYDTLVWQIEVSDEAAAQRVLPLELNDGVDFRQAWVGSIFNEDLWAINRNAHHALRNNEPGYTQVFRCRAANGETVWLREETAIEMLAPGRWQIFGVATDVTTQQIAEKLINESEQRFRSLFDNNLDPIFSLGPDGRFANANHAALTVSGYTLEELLGKHFLDLCPPNERDVAATAFRDALCRRCGNVDTAILTKSGRRRDLFITGAPVVVDGEVVGVSCIARDITERKKAEDQLRASELLLSRTGKVAGVGGWELNLETMALSWTAQTKIIHEVPPDHVPSLETAIEFYAPEARPLIETAVKEGIEHGTPWDLELPFITAGGRRIWVRAMGEVERRNGKAVRLFGAFQDITARRQNEAALSAERTLLRTLIDSMPDRVFTTDTEGRYVICNAAHARFRGARDESEIAGKTIFDFHPPERAQKFRDDDLRVLGGETVLSREEIVAASDGSQHWFLTTKVPLRDPSGQINGMVCVSSNIDERKRAEWELRSLLTNARCIMWRSEVTDMAGTKRQPGDLRTGLSWKTEIADEQSARQLVPLDVPAGSTYHDQLVASWNAEDRRRMNETSRTAILQNAPGFGQDFRCTDKFGRTIWLHEEATIIAVSPGRWQVFGVLFDVTDRKHAELELRAVLANTRCILWRAEVRAMNDQQPTDSPNPHWFRWRIHIEDVDGANQVLPLDLLPGESYAGAWQRSRSEEASRKANATSREAMLGGRPGYSQELPCTDKSGRQVTLAEEVTVALVT